MSNKHTAVTIGPIYKTIHNVKSTKAIWAASYMFSYLIKKLLIATKVKSDDVILPYFEKDDLTAITGVGLFPDRILFKKEIPNIGELIDNVIEEFANEVEKDLGKNPNILNYLKDYIHFHHFSMDVDDDNNAIDLLNKHLNTLELKNRVVLNANDDILYKFFENKPYNFLIKNEYLKGEQRFPSTIEIAMAEFNNNEVNKFRQAVNEIFKEEKVGDEIDNQQRFIEKIYENDIFSNLKRNYQKYIAVVQADGDNIGGFIAELYNQPDKHKLIEEFSKNLLAFSKGAVKLINEYKGTPIYAGGDDLLFICPVAHSILVDSNDNRNEDRRTIIKVKSSIITLIKQLDVLFDEKFTNYPMFSDIIKSIRKKPSMSYGVSISYYKFPLNQALEQGVNQLFYKAKKTCDKDAVSYAVLKHSGQFMGALFHKNRQSYILFDQLIKTQVANDNYVRSITYKLEHQEAVIYGIGAEKIEIKRNEKFDNFFDNNFNENVHIKYVNGKKMLIDFLELSKNLLKAIYKENPIFVVEDVYKKKERNKQNINQLYAALRFVDFINTNEER